MKLVTADTMKELDRFTIHEIGIPGIVLMEMAGKAVADTVEELLVSSGLKRVVIVCGPGNNGGDGFVTARHLLDHGHDVRVVILTEKHRIVGDALTNLKALEYFNAAIQESPDGIPDETVEWAGQAVIVDAIFGTGLQRYPAGIFADTIDIMNTLPGPSVAVDIPSGIDADCGAVLGTAFDAHVTVTFGAAKLGQFVWPGCGHCGKVKLVPIGIPESLIEKAPDIQLLENSHAAASFRPRPRDSYKNTFGHVVVIGGLPGKSGATVHAALAAIRSGAGLTSVITSEASAARIEGRHPDLMIEPLLKVADGWLTVDDAEISRFLADKGSIVIGPGLSTAPGTASAIKAILGAGLPTVIDADALNVIATNQDLIAAIGPDTVITPHPGEAARLLGIDSAEVQNNRVKSALDLAAKTGATTVLKGAGTIIASPDGRLAVCPSGSPALAVAGSGDVLAGIIGALLARGRLPFEAACAGVFLHGLTGDKAAEKIGEHSVAATDLVDLIPEAIRIVCKS